MGLVVLFCLFMPVYLKEGEKEREENMFFSQVTEFDII